MRRGEVHSPWQPINILWLFTILHNSFKTFLNSLLEFLNSSFSLASSRFLDKNVSIINNYTNSLIPNTFDCSSFLSRNNSVFLSSLQAVIIMFTRPTSSTFHNTACSGLVYHPYQPSLTPGNIPPLTWAVSSVLQIWREIIS